MFSAYVALSSAATAPWNWSRHHLVPKYLTFLRNNQRNFWVKVFSNFSKLNDLHVHNYIGYLLYFDVKATSVDYPPVWRHATLNPKSILE